MQASPEARLVLTLIDVASHLSKRGERLAAKEGLTTLQWLVLLQIAGDPNFPTRPGTRSRPGEGVLASEIAAARGVSRGNISTVVSALLARGLVQQREDPGDRRRKVLTATSAGRRALEGIEPIRRAANAALFSDLSDDEMAAFGRLLERCLRDLQGEDSPAAAIASDGGSAR
jgi:DNA-binding MarR family transcriptional regulator